jgi:hypothetical protein
MEIVPYRDDSPKQRDRPTKRRKAKSKSRKTGRQRKDKGNHIESDSSEGEEFDMNVSSDSESEVEQTPPPVQHRGRRKDNGKAVNTSEDTGGAGIPALSVGRKAHAARGPEDRKDGQAELTPESAASGHVIRPRSISPLPPGAKFGPPRKKAKSQSAIRPSPTEDILAPLSMPSVPPGMNEESAGRTQEPLSAKPSSSIPKTDGRQGIKRKRPVPIFNKRSNPEEEYDGSRKTRSMVAMDKLNEEAERKTTKANQKRKKAKKSRKS